MEAKNNRSTLGAGLKSVPEALAFLVSRPGLWGRTIIPVLATVLVFALFFTLWMFVPIWLFGSFELVEANAVGAEETGWWTSLWEGFLSILGVTGSWILWILWTVTGLMLCYLLFSTIGMIVAGPFMESLTLEVERLLGLDEQVDLGIMKGTVAAVADGSRAAFHSIFWSLLVLPFVFVPVVGWIPIFLVAARTMYREQLEIPMARRAWDQARKKAWRRSHRAAGFGLGCAGAGLMMIPFLNLLIFPVLAVAGTLLFCRLEHAVAPGDVGQLK